MRQKLKLNHEIPETCSVTTKQFKQLNASFKKTGLIVFNKKNKKDIPRIEQCLIRLANEIDLDAHFGVWLPDGYKMSGSCVLDMFTEYNSGSTPEEKRIAKEEFKKKIEKYKL